MKARKCDVVNCNEQPKWRCVDSGMLYCDKHKVRHRMSNDSPWHVFVPYHKAVRE